MRAKQLPRLRELLANHTTDSDAPATQTTDDELPPNTYTCPACGAPMMIIETFGKQMPRAPPVYP